MTHWPVAHAQQVVGLLGGSFDPPHAGHLHISKAALHRFGLDRLWWLVSPGNPLKPHGPAPIEQRMQAAREMIRHPRIEATDIEAQLGTRYTARTLEKLRKHYRDVHFVWVMGADNLAGLHEWRDWRDIMDSVPVGVVARPGERTAARFSKAARIYRAARLPARHAAQMGRMQPPVWSFVNIPMSAEASSDIRARGEW